MTKYLQKSFSVGGSSSNAYRENYEKIFAKTDQNAQAVTLLDPLQRDLLTKDSEKPPLNEVVIRLPHDDFEALRVWAVFTNERPLDPDVAHTVLMAVADAVVGK